MTVSNFWQDFKSSEIVTMQKTKMSSYTLKILTGQHYKKLNIKYETLFFRKIIPGIQNTVCS